MQDCLTMTSSYFPWKKNRQWIREYAETTQITTQILTSQEIETKCFGKENSS